MASGGPQWAAPALPEVKLTKPRREKLVSNLSTNAKVEPIEWAPVRVEAPGLVVKVFVKLSDSVEPGTAIAQVSNPGLADQLKAAEARTAQAQADLDALSKGGRSAELADIENSLTKTKFERDIQQKDYSSLKRLYDKHAATMMDVEIAKDKLHSSELEIESLERRRAALVSKDDLAAGRARVLEAQASERAAGARLAGGVIRSPSAGLSTTCRYAWVLT